MKHLNREDFIYDNPRLVLCRFLAMLGMTHRVGMTHVEAVDNSEHIS